MVQIRQYAQQTVPTGGEIRASARVIDVSSGLENVANTASNELARRKAVIDRKNANDDALELIKRDSEWQVKSGEMFDQAAHDHQEGDPPIVEGLLKQTEDYFKTLPELKTDEGKLRSAQHKSVSISTLRDHAINWQAKTNVSQFNANVEASIENFKKAAARDPTKAQSYADNLNNGIEAIDTFTGAQKSELKSKANNELSATAEMSLLEKGLFKDREKRWTWKQLTYEQQQQLTKYHQEKVRMYEAERTQSARDVIESNKEAFTSGYVVNQKTTQQTQEAISILKSDPKTKAIGEHYQKTIIDDYGTRQAFGQQTFPDQVKVLNELEKNITQGTGGNQADLLRQRDMLAKQFNQQIVANAKDPYALLAAKTGKYIAPINFQEPLEEQLASRKKSLSQVQESTGIEPSLFSEEEAKNLFSFVDKLPTDQQAGYLTSLVGATGTAKPKTIDMLVRLDPVKGIAAAAKDKQTSDHRLISQVLLAGNNKLKTKDVDLGKSEDLLKKEFNKNIAPGLADGDADASYQAFKAAYAYYTTSRDGSEDPSAATKTLQTDAVKNAKSVLNPATTFNGAQTYMPFNMNPSHFNDLVKEKLGAMVGAKSEAEKRHFLSNTVVQQQFSVDLDGGQAYVYYIYTDGAFKKTDSGLNASFVIGEHE